MSDAPFQKQDPPSDRDRATFKKRLKEALAARAMSGRALEARVGMATGTLSKMYSGRISVTLRHLREIAAVLEIGPEVLVMGTSLAALLTGAPESSESEELLQTKGQIDQLRASLAGSEAIANDLRREVHELKDTIAALQGKATDAEERARQAKNDLVQVELRASAAEGERACFQTERAAAIEDANRMRRELAAASAAARANEEAATSWRTFGLKRAHRVQYLEAELAKTRSAAMNASAAEAGRLLLASLTTLGIGYAIGDSSS